MSAKLARAALILSALLIFAAGSPMAQATHVEMDKTHDPLKPSYQHGDLVTFIVEITVRDLLGGTVISIRDLKITDTLPPGLTYQLGTQTSTPAASFSAVGQVLTWDFGIGPFLSAPHAHVEFQAKVDDTVAQGTPLINEARADYTETVSGAPSSPTVTDIILEKFPILDIAKDAAPPIIHEGDAVTYTITLTNTGGEDAVGVEVTDPLPSHVAYSGGATATSGTVDDSNPAVIVWKGDIPAGGTVTVTIPVTDKPLDKVNLITDTATYTKYPANAEMIKLSDDASTQVIHPKITLVKTCAPASGVEPLDVTYTYKIQNTGDVPLTLVKVHDDTLGAYVTVPATLAVLEIKQGTLPRTGLTEGVYVNTATASGVDPLGLTVTATDDATCTVTKQPPPPPVVGGEVLLPSPDASALARDTLAVTLAAVGAVLLLWRRA